MAKTARQKIVDKLDGVVSRIVIARDKRCVVCGRGSGGGRGYGLGSGHVFSRKAYSTRWDISRDGNVHCQCWPCNYKHVKDQYSYFTWYINEFGQDEFDKLRRRFNTTLKLSTPDLEQLYENLKTISEEMDKTGKIVKRPTPEDVQISKEEAKDYSLEERIKHALSEKEV